MSDTVLLKIKNGEDIRRARINSPNYLELQETLSSLFGPGPFKIQYEDDEGDQVSLTSYDELVEAVRICRTCPKFNNVLRLQVNTLGIEESGKEEEDESENEKDECRSIKVEIDVEKAKKQLKDEQEKLKQHLLEAYSVVRSWLQEQETALRNWLQTQREKQRERQAAARCDHQEPAPAQESPEASPPVPEVVAVPVSEVVAPVVPEVPPVVEAPVPVPEPIPAPEPVPEPVCVPAPVPEELCVHHEEHPVPVDSPSQEFVFLSEGEDEAQAAAAAEAEAEEVHFKEQLAVLEGMGFNRELSLAVLVKHNGALDAAVDELLVFSS